MLTVFTSSEQASEYVRTSTPLHSLAGLEKCGLAYAAAAWCMHCGAILTIPRYSTQEPTRYPGPVIDRSTSCSDRNVWMKPAVTSNAISRHQLTGRAAFRRSGNQHLVTWHTAVRSTSHLAPTPRADRSFGISSRGPLVLQALFLPCTLALLPKSASYNNHMICSLGYADSSEHISNICLLLTQMNTPSSRTCQSVASYASRRVV